MAHERSKRREESQEIEPRRSAQLSRLGGWPVLSPFGMMRRFADEMDRVFDRMFEGTGPTGLERFTPWQLSERFSPEVDILERDGKLVITDYLTVMTKDDVKVDITDGAVLIEGERKYQHEEHEEGVYRAERGFGHFRRQIPLPEGVKTDTATAKFKNGVLEVTIEAPQLTKGRRRIQVQGEESGPKSGQSAA